MSREQVLLGVKILDELSASPSKEIEDKRPVKEHWLHLQKNRRGDSALENVDLYVAHMASEAKEKAKSKKKKESTTTSSGTSGLSAMSVESEESVKDPIAPSMATTSSLFGKGWGLGDVAANDHLYLVAHGMLGGPKVGDWDDPRDQYSPKDIADRLVKSGLSKEHRTIKLFACWGAVSVTSLDPRVVKKDDRPFAERLAAEMASRGYLNIEVHGYGGTVSTPFNKRTDESDGSKKVSFAEKLSLDDYPKYHGYALAQARASGLERIGDTDVLRRLGYMSVASHFESRFGLTEDPDTGMTTIGKLTGWGYRGVYLTDTKGVPWVVVLPYPPETIAHEHGIEL